MDFTPIDASEEEAILKEAEAQKKPRKKKGPDFSIRTVTHWFTLQHHFAYCSIPSHYDNVPDKSEDGSDYDKSSWRMCVTIDDYEVCRWCYIVEADQQAILDGVPPEIRTEETEKARAND